MISPCTSNTVSKLFVNAILKAYGKAGMNDVLPKPFTKEGLLNMLEKHLGHLKQMPDGMEPMAPHPGSSIPQSSTAQSLKDESSPAQSPSTVSNWQSPGQFAGISPTQAAAPHQFMHPMQAAYGQETGPVHFQTPHTPLGAPRQMQHRRQISEIGGEDMTSDSKRQRMYDQSNALGMNTMNPGRPR